MQDDDLVRVLGADGALLPGALAPELTDDELVHLYGTMLLVRVMDERMVRLQRQGRLGFYMTSTGEEASHLAVHALRDSDWIYPSYREPGALFLRGGTIPDFINQLFGNEHDPVKGRQMPVHHALASINLVSISSPVGTQIPQAVGTGLAAKLSGKDDVAVVYFGEGTSSTGDFHVALNFAGVMKAPVLFILRNNGWAISTPSARQTAGSSYAVRGAGYGMPGVRVDGNDALAVVKVAREAVARARAGEGPTLIEAVTYRRGGHSTSDDPSAYRDAAEVDPWAERDPLGLLRRYMERRGIWSDEQEQATVARFNEQIAEVTATAMRAGPPPLESMFEEVYEEIPWHLAEQRDQLMQSKGRE
jgi:pyruvate dehydrogenase E1 component alpha subunit